MVVYLLFGNSHAARRCRGIIGTAHLCVSPQQIPRLHLNLPEHVQLQFSSVNMQPCVFICHVHHQGVDCENYSVECLQFDVLVSRESQLSDVDAGLSELYYASRLNPVDSHIFARPRWPATVWIIIIISVPALCAVPPLRTCPLSRPEAAPLGPPHLSAGAR